MNPQNEEISNTLLHNQRKIMERNYRTIELSDSKPNTQAQSEYYSTFTNFIQTILILRHILNLRQSPNK